MGESCICVTLEGDWDSGEVDGRTLVETIDKYCTARRKHQCYECDCTIHPGEPIHMRQNFYSPKGIGTFVTCATCAHIREQLACSPGFVVGGLRDAIKSCFRTDYVTGEEISEDEAWEY